MLRRGFLLSVTCVCVFALALVAEPAEESKELVTVTIILDAERDIPSRVMAAMRTETERLLRIPGMAIDWRWLQAEGTCGEVFDRVIMARLTGVCASRPMESKLVAGDALGITHVSNGAILPFLEIDCGRVNSLLHSRAFARVALSPEVVGRAVARVLAHEAYHILAGTTDHSHNGVARTCYRRSDLIREDFCFDDHCKKVMSEAVLMASSPAAR